MLPPWSASAVPAKDFRIDYLDEARECLRASNKIATAFPEHWHEKPEFWANLLGAVANSNVAAASENVAMGLLYKQDKRKQEKERLKKMLDEQLCRTTGG